MRFNNQIGNADLLAEKEELLKQINWHAKKLEEIKEQSEKAVALDDVLAKKESEITEKNEEFDKIVDIIEKKKISVKYFEDDYNAIKIKKDSLIEEKDGIIERLQGEIDEKMATIETIEKDKQKLTKDVALILFNISELDGKNVALSTQLSGLNNNIKNVERVIVERKEILDALNKEIQNLEKNRQLLVEKNDELVSIGATLNGNQSSVNEEMKELLEMKSKLESEVGILKIEAERIEKENVAKLGDISLKEHWLEKKEGKLKEIKNTLEEIRGKKIPIEF